ncbi:MAG: sugar phosphate isomerase/epimerase [Kiritimatiellaeota bacterium]|nr:sugar phosphate isomerase/epimerase [Kiritimatiellota bacterium]
MKLSFTTLGCPNWDVSMIVKRAVEYGYNGVDFRGYFGEMDLRKSPAFASGEIAQTARRIHDAGLAVSALSSGAHMFDATPEARRASLDEMKAYAEMAAKMNAGFARIFGGGLGGVPLEDALPVAAQTLCHASDIAQQAGIVFVVETHDDWIESARLARAFELAEFPKSVEMLWDVHHPYRCAHESPETTWANIGRHVRYTHWKDSLPKPDGGYTLTRFGQGDIPLKKIFDVMTAGGYDGWHTLEWEKRWCPYLDEPEVAFPDFVRVLRSFQI